MKNDWNLATWNVRGVFRAGALRNLTQELNRFNIMIAAIQEKRWHTVQLFTESDDTRCCDNTICPPEDGHVDARNMSQIIT